MDRRAIGVQNAHKTDKAPLEERQQEEEDWSLELERRRMVERGLVRVRANFQFPLCGRLHRRLENVNMHAQGPACQKAASLPDCFPILSKRKIVRIQL